MFKSKIYTIDVASERCEFHIIKIGILNIHIYTYLSKFIWIYIFLLDIL